MPMWTPWRASPVSSAWPAWWQPTPPSPTTTGPGACPAHPCWTGAGDRGVELVGRVRRILGPDAVIIGVGGISTAAHAQRYLDAGATVVQAYTAFIYRGPAWPGRVNRALVSGRGSWLG